MVHPKNIPGLKGLAIILAAYLALAALALGGMASGIGLVGDDAREVAGSLALYWLLSSSFFVLFRLGKSNPKEMVLTGCSLVVAFLIVEAGLRVRFPARSQMKYHGILSSTYHHILPANVVMGQGPFQGRYRTIKTNEDGFRTSYDREEFRKFGVRVAMIGDSLPFGMGVDQAESFPEVTEALLRERLGRDDIGVLNTGVISYSPLLYERLLRGVVHHYSPTHIMVFFNSTDVGDDINYAKELREGPEGTFFDLSDFRTISQEDTDYHGALYEFSRGYLKRPLAYLSYPLEWFGGAAQSPSREDNPPYEWFRFRLEIDRVIETNRFFIYRHPLPFTEPFYAKTFAYIQSMADFATGMGATFTFVIVPRYHHWSDRESPLNWENGEYTVDEPYEYQYIDYFKKAGLEAGMNVLDLLPSFRETDEFPLVFEDDPHWNARGHRFAAEVITQNLIEAGLGARGPDAGLSQ